MGGDTIAAGVAGAGRLFFPARGNFLDNLENGGLRLATPIEAPSTTVVPNTF